MEEMTIDYDDDPRFERARNALEAAITYGFCVETEKENSMKQKLSERHEIDAVGNLGGGETLGMGIAIVWQNGPLGRGDTRKEPNGAFVESVIQAAIGRLRFYQETKVPSADDKSPPRSFACRENAIALTKLEEAFMWLEERTADREAREVEGTHTP
jgi:hypothetical protein